MGAPYELVECQRERMSQRLHPQHSSVGREIRGRDPIEQSAQVDVMKHRAANNEIERPVGEWFLRVGNAEFEAPGDLRRERPGKTTLGYVDAENVVSAAGERQAGRFSPAGADVEHASAVTNGLADQRFPLRFLPIGGQFRA